MGQVESNYEHERIKTSDHYDIPQTSHYQDISQTFVESNLEQITVEEDDLESKHISIYIRYLGSSLIKELQFQTLSNKPMDILIEYYQHLLISGNIKKVVEHLCLPASFFTIEGRSNICIPFWRSSHATEPLMYKEINIHLKQYSSLEDIMDWLRFIFWGLKSQKEEISKEKFTEDVQVEIYREIIRALLDYLNWGSKLTYLPEKDELKDYLESRDQIYLEIAVNRIRNITERYYSVFRDLDPKSLHNTLQDIRKKLMPNVESIKGSYHTCEVVISIPGICFKDSSRDVEIRIIVGSDVVFSNGSYQEYYNPEEQDVDLRSIDLFWRCYDEAVNKGAREDIICFKFIKGNFINNRVDRPSISVSFQEDLDNVVKRLQALRNHSPKHRQSLIDRYIK